ncbi:septal ring lytic transglycosylase RlpA family protein [uncultured Sphaerotilus sp.]|uniref:septal ring lytic transglycosylase RlpA family protein n=1 Tax=uncultured Sphaerotilus sp. TaxID=474984 RepID=UPI0030CA3C3A
MKVPLHCLSLALALTTLVFSSHAAEEQATSEAPRSPTAAAAAELPERAASAATPFERLVERPIGRVTSAAGAVVTGAATAATNVATTAANTATHAAVDAATAATAAVFSVANVATSTAVNAATAAATLFQTGRVSFYADKFHGRPTASGALYNAEEMTMAHRTLPIGTKVMITNTTNQRSVVVTVNDRGPFTGGRVADLSRAAAEKLNMIRVGIAEATLHVLPNSGNKQDSKTKVR